LLTLGNILHGSVVDATGLGNNNLLLTMWWMVDVAVSDALLQSSALSGKVSCTIIVEVGIAGGDSSGRWHRQV
jgi:hypothetical protein